jgi:hypothetical protein
MKIPITFGLVIVATILIAALDLSAGRPGPPQRHPPGRRQANMLMLRFQDALADGRWDEALSFCSARVRAKAAEWPTLKDFFTDTMPIEHVLAQDFGCWSCATNFYGLFVTLSEPGAEPRLDWHWGLMPTENGWVVDYPPARLTDYIVNKKAALVERDNRIQEVRQSLAPKTQKVTTRLTPVTERFVIGSPMLFRLELVNSGAASVHYMDMGVRYKPLTVLDKNKQSIPYVAQPMQIMVTKAELAAGASVLLADKIDINAGAEIPSPGTYLVQFDSSDLQIGQPVPAQEMGRFGETLPLTVFDFLAATNKFPSNIIEIQVGP